MITTLHRAGQQKALDPPARGRVPRQGTSGKSFLSESLAAIGTSTKPKSTIAPAAGTRQVVATPSAPRQNPAAAVIAATPQPWEAIFNSTPQPAGAPAETKPVAAAAPLAARSTAAADGPALQGDDAIVQSLKDALTAAGIGFEGLGLAAHQDVVTYPGGSYINRYISVNTNGHEEGLMTDLVGINPNIAVVDIKHMLGRG